MKNKRSNALAACLLALLLITVGMTGYLDTAVYAAAPGDENYDDDAGYSNATTQFTVDGLKYTLTGPGPDTLVTNVAPSGWGELGDGGSDNFISIMGIDTLKIEADNGSYFKLNGFEMGFCSVAGITITPETGAAITRARAGDESYYTIDVSANTDFEYIRYFTISGTDMIMNIDDLDFSPAVLPTHTVTYNGNGNTGGSAPTDGSSPYTEGDTVTVLGNTGTLVKTGYSFAGWNTAANGSGTDYAPAATFTLGTSNVTLYAKWAPLYTVTYNGNSNTGGAVPTDGNSYLSGDTVTVLDNTGTLVRTGYTFAGWNTATNGSGTTRAPAATFAMGGSNVTLYALWTPIDYSVTYNGNTNTGGAVPTDATGYHITDTVTVLGNTGTLVKTGYTFAGWNTAANGSGDGYAPAATFAMGSSNVTLYAQWTENTYTVTYNGNSNTGGAVPTDGSSYYNGDTATVLGNTGTLVRTGYTFAGWNTAANGSGTGYVGGNTFGIGLSNVTLYAQWTPIDYTVTYNGNTNTGGAVPTDGNAYHITDTVTVLGNTGTLVKTGYTFAGWNTAANGSGTSYSGGNTFAMGSGNVTLYAQWTENTYNVTYSGNGNTGGAVPTDGTDYHTTDTATVLGNTGTLVRTGYTFAGWNTVAGGSGTGYTGGDTFAIGTSNVTLYAQWTANDYSVTYNGNTNTGGVVPTDGNTYHITDTVTVLGNTGTLVKTGYTFAGWNTAANGSGTDYSGGNTFAMGGGNVTLYAQWTENVYSVTYNGNSNTGGAVPTDATSYHTTDTATVLGNTGTLVRIGYTFADWNTAANGSGTSYTGGDTFAIGSANVTLYAQWTNNDYTVTYNGNTNTGGSVPTDGSTYHITDTVTVLGNTGTLVKTGYIFTGWNTAANGSGTSYSGGGTFAMGGSNVTLYAQWSQTYTVTYDGNTNTGGAVPTDSGDYENGDTVTVLGNTGTLVKTGYTFAGWNTAANGSGTSYSGGGTFAMGAGNVTLYAQWTENTYTMTYDGNTSISGSVPTDGTAYHDGDTVTVLGNSGTLAKTGYSFDGWNTAANGSDTDYSAADTFVIGSANVTLYAQWSNNEYTVTYDGNTNTGGSVPTDGSTYHITDTVTVLGNTGTLVKTGYTFAGWNTAANGSGTSYSGGGTFAIGAGNVTLYAQWTENTYTITYDGNTSISGSVPTDGTAYHEGDTVTVLGNTGTLAKTDYSFDGWNTAANGSGTDYSAADTFAIGANNVTLYAQWTNNDYTVTYNGNGSTGGTVPTDGSSYHITDTITVLGNTGTLVKTRYTFGGWNTAANGSGTTYAAGGTLTMGSANVTLYAKWNTSSSGGGGGGSTPPPVPPPNTSGADIIVNGETESAGTSTTTTEVGGESVTTVVVDEVKIEQRLAQEENGATVTIPINQNSDVVVGQLNGQMVKNMENREAVLEIRTAGVTYTLPAEQIDIDGVSLQLGQSVDLRDITVSIEVSTVTGQGVQFVQNIAEKGAFTIVAPPLEFNVRCTHGNQIVNVNSFNAYVERTVAIPDGIDPAKVTTGVVIGTDGTIHHVPTRITIIDGRYYAQINSLTNSTYALIYNPIIFADVDKHWSRNAVNNMASRMVIKGMDDTTFAPDRQTTRAEFATILIRGLGLTESKYTGMYTDIQGSDWYAGSIATANAYNIVKGYDDGTFRPNNTITREEAMAMIAAALKVAEKEMKLTKEEVDTLLQQFTDCCDVSDWAASPVSICVKRGIVAGDNQAIRPLDHITRAEMATMIQRMLQAMKLI